MHRLPPLTELRAFEAAARHLSFKMAAAELYVTPTDLARLQSLAFREELHAIEAAISGQGIAICSDVLVAPELASGALVQVSKLTLPGYGFYLVHRSGHPKLASISAFSAWARSMQKNIW